MTSGKRYIGQRPADDEIGDCRVFVEIGDQVEPLRHVVWRSPNGFEWGYSGAGPADLALSILADHFGERPTEDELDRGRPRCWQLHLAFKRDILSHANRAGFVLTSEQVADWLSKQEPQ